MKLAATKVGVGLVALTFASLLSHFAWAGALGQGPDLSIPWFRLSGGLGICMLLAYAGALILRRQTASAPDLFAGNWAELLAKRFGGMALSSPARIAVVQTLSIGNRVEVVLLRLDGREFVIATSPNGAPILLEPADGSQ